MLFNKLFFLLLFCFTCITLDAQEFSYTNYTIEDGLPSNEVYSLLEDSKGYIWIGTDRGVCRFNGYEFENFTTYDGLPDNTIFNFYEDYKGRIWFYTFNGEIGFFFEEKFYNISLLEESKFLIDGIFVSENDEVSIAFEGMNIVEFSLSNNQLKANSINIKGSVRRYKKRDLDGSLEQFEKNTKETIERIKNDLSFYKNTKSYSLKIAPNTFCELTKEFNYCLVMDSLKNIVYSIKLDEDIERFTGIGRVEEYWYLTTTGNKILKFQYGLFNEPFETIDLGSYIPSKVLVDDFGGMWVSTLNRGVIYAPNTEVKMHRVKPSIVGDGLVQFKKNESIELFLNKNHELHRSSLRDKSNFPTISYDLRREGIHMFNSDFIVFGRDQGDLFNRFGNRIDQLANDSILTLFYQGMTTLSVTKNGDVVAGRLRSIIVNNEEIQCEQLRRPVAIEIEGDTIWVGDFNGLFAFSLSRKKIIQFKKPRLLENRVSKLGMLKNILIIGTRGEGLLLKTNNELIQLTKADGISDNSITSIETNGENTIWIAGNNGVTKITITATDPLKYSILNIGKEDGILSREIRGLQLFKDSLYILTEFSIYQLHEDYKVNKVQPKFYIKSLFVNNQEHDFSKKIELNYTQNNIEFKFEGLYFKNNSDLVYEYSLDNGSTWTATQNRFVIFKDLPPGNYSFRIRTVTSKGEKSNERNIKFIISPPFWRTWLFYLLIALLAGLILLVSAKIYVRQVKLKSTILESELKALRSMMNPHFTFNSINSIQHFIVQKDTKGALDFTSKFAGLIRMILSNSANEFITVQKELDALRLYMEIEQTRLDAKFTFQIIVAKSIDPDFEKIPSMILQPYVENALWHGIMNKEGEGRIEIGIEANKKGVFCYVEDDGVGRKRANEFKGKLKADRKSLGMSLTKERLELLRKSSGRNMDVTVVDLYDANNLGIGTRVEINIENFK